MAKPTILTRHETSLHADLKVRCTAEEGKAEQVVVGYIIDVLREGELVEVQTGSFSALRAKLEALLPHHVVRVVYPVAVERWIVRIDIDGKRISRRKSPRRGSLYQVFDELTSLHAAIAHPNFRLEVVLVHEEQVWRDDGMGSWRRKHWSLSDRGLLEVVGRHPFDCPADFARLLPESLPEEFTTTDLRQALNLHARGDLRRLVGRMARALRTLGVIRQVGKRGSAYLYRRVM